jgi:hypothetical protein
LECGCILAQHYAYAFTAEYFSGRIPGGREVLPDPAARIHVVLVVRRPERTVAPLGFDFGAVVEVRADFDRRHDCRNGGGYHPAVSLDETRRVVRVPLGEVRMFDGVLPVRPSQPVGAAPPAVVCQGVEHLKLELLG